MDIPHHALIGVAGFMYLASTGNEMPAVAFMAGSIAPDTDVIFMAKGKISYLKNHQGLTHSIPAALVTAGVLSAVLSTYTGQYLLSFAAALAGFLMHALLDASNTYGTMLIWPISKRRIRMDYIFFIDSVSWAMTLIMAFSLYKGVHIAFPVYLATLALYMAFRMWLHGKVKRKLQAAYAIPSALNPFEFFITEVDNTGAITYRYSALSAKKTDIANLPPEQEEHLKLAEKSSLYKEMRQVLRHPYITQVTSGPEGGPEGGPDGTTLTIKDIAIRNFGGRFGAITLIYDADGNLINEHADI